MANVEKITDKNREFIRQYFLNDGNGTKAAIAAGLGGQNPQQYESKLLQKPLIKEEIEKERQRIADAFVVKAAQKKRWLVKIVEKCLGEDEDDFEPELDELGIPIEDETETRRKLFMPDQAIRAIGELNKMEGDHAAVKASIGVVADVSETADNAGLQSFAERVETLFQSGTKGDS